MAYDTYLVERISNLFKERKLEVRIMKMMGGLCYMLDEKMCCGVLKNQLMARVSPDLYEELLQKPGCNEMNFTGRPMKGYVFVNEDAIDKDADLAYWIDLCIAFNPLAKSTKKKK